MGEVVSYTKDGIEELIASAIASAAPSANAVGAIVHGSDPNVARPPGYLIVYWIGTVEPVNAAINDVRIDPDASPTTIEFATQADIDAAIAALRGTAPALLDTLGEISDALNDDANAAATLTTLITGVKTGAMGVVIHGAVAGTARPAGYGAIHWIGSVSPTNAIDNDVWTDTSA